MINTKFDSTKEDIFPLNEEEKFIFDKDKLK